MPIDQERITLPVEFEPRRHGPASGLRAAAVAIPLSGRETLSPSALAAIFYVFLLISRISEFTDKSGRLHIVLIAATVALLLSIVTLRVRFAFQDRIGWCLTAFTSWLIFALPFSSWRGGSFHALTDTWLKSYLTYVILAAAIANLAQLRAAMVTVAVATGCVVLLAFKFGVHDSGDDRFYFAGGSFANSNDLAMALLLGLPLLFWLASDKGRNIFVRLAALCVVPVLLNVVLNTGSRAALIALGVMSAIFFLRTSMKNRALVLLAAVALAVAAPFVLSRALKDRYYTILTGRDVGSGASDVMHSAAESEDARRKLMVQALVVSARHPLFGVGLDQFQYASTNVALERGETPLWHSVHNSFLLVLAETGVPGLIFYLGTMFYCARNLLWVSGRVKKLTELWRYRGMAEALMYSFAGFAVCMCFSTGAYLYHLPLLAAAIAGMKRLASSTIPDDSGVHPRITH